MKEINVVSSNENKVQEMSELAKDSGIRLKWLKYSKVEVQAQDPKEVARVGAAIAYNIFRCPLIVDDSGVFIEALGGFPGAYAAQFYKAIGTEGILRMLNGVRNRRASMKTAICYADDDIIKVFEGVVDGDIAEKTGGGRDFAYDPIFIPDGYKNTFSELGLGEKNKVSHRAIAFRKFAEFFKQL